MGQELPGMASYKASPLDEVAGNTSGIIDMVILPPKTGGSFESDENEGADDDGIDYLCVPADVPGEVEVYLIEQDESDEDDIDEQTTSERWRKRQELGLSSHNFPPNINDRMQ